MSTNIVEIEKVSKRFVIRKEKSLKERVVNFGRSNLHKEDFWALRDVDLAIETGSTVGLLGPNGSGKSTLLKMIGGILQPTTGSVRTRGRMAALLELGAGFHPDLTGRENVYLNASILGLSKAQTDSYFDSIIDFSGIAPFIDTQVKFYSSGMYMRLAFAVAVHVDPDVLLVDEVLAVGDEPFQRKCMDRIREFQSEGRTIILVSHSLGQVGELCDRAIVLNHGSVVADDVPEIALRALREEFEVVRQEQEVQASAPVAPPIATVQRVELLGSDGTPVRDLASGDTLRIAVTYASDTPLDDWRAGIRIETALAQVVFGTNTVYSGVDLPVLSGERTVVFTVPEVSLTAGQYYVAGAIGHRDGTPIHQVEQGAMFTVTSPVQTLGVVDLHPTITAT